MKLDLTKIELNKNDLETLHDIVYEALGLDWRTDNLTDEQIITYWNQLPDNIKLEAVQWGISDTPTKEKIYVWLKEMNSKI